MDKVRHHKCGGRGVKMSVKVGILGSRVSYNLEEASF